MKQCAGQNDETLFSSLTEDNPTAPIEQFRHQWRFLSNFYPCQVWRGIRSFETVEHAYQAAKTKKGSEVDDIRNASSPFLAKRLGRKVTLRPDWEEIKLEVMAELLFQKFVLNRELRAKLLSTGDRQLIEGNDWGDTVWGVCNGSGKNHLGKLLMEIRVIARHVITVNG